MGGTDASVFSAVAAAGGSSGIGAAGAAFATADVGGVGGVATSIAGPIGDSAAGVMGAGLTIASLGRGVGLSAGAGSAGRDRQRDRRRRRSGARARRCWCDHRGRRRSRRIAGRPGLVRRRCDNRSRIARLDVVEDHIAGDADRDGITERGALADRDTGNLGDDSVHRQASPGRSRMPPVARREPNSSGSLTGGLRQHQVDQGTK